MPAIAAHNPLSSRKTRLTATTIVVLAFLLPAVGLILAGVNHGPQFSDQQEYHIPTIWQFASEWPNFDFRSYPAAMTPGYHLAMAAIARAGGGGAADEPVHAAARAGGCVTAMQLVTALRTAGLLAARAWTVGRRVAAIDAVLLCLPVAW